MSPCDVIRRNEEWEVRMGMEWKVIKLENERQLRWSECVESIIKIEEGWCGRRGGEEEGRREE